MFGHMFSVCSASGGCVTVSSTVFLKAAISDSAVAAAFVASTAALVMAPTARVSASSYVADCCSTETSTCGTGQWQTTTSPSSAASDMNWGLRGPPAFAMMPTLLHPSAVSPAADQRDPVAVQVEHRSVVGQHAAARSRRIADHENFSHHLGTSLFVVREF